MNTNINYTIDNTYLLIEEIIKQYLARAVFTIDFVEITKINEDSINCKSLIIKETTKGKQIANTELKNIKIANILNITNKLTIGDKGLLFTIKSNRNSFDPVNSFYLPVNYITNTQQEEMIIINGKTKIQGDTEIVAEQIKMKGETTIEGNTSITGEVNVSGTMTSGTISTGGVSINNQQGISGAFSNSAGQKLIFNNGIITKVE